MTKNSTKKAISKPTKPYATFPLFPHATKRWAKKINGKMHYFGPWDNPTKALAKYQEQKDDLYAGLKPRSKTPGLMIKDLCNRFLTAKRHLLDTRELSPRTFKDHHKVCDRIVTTLGNTRLVTDLDSEDFEGLRKALAKTLAPLALGVEIQRVRSVFKYGYDATLIPAPIRFGPGFKKPSRKVLRAVRKKKGKKLLPAADIKAPMADTSIQMKAMILLALNAALGNHDVSQLDIPHVDLKQGWIDFPRPKTGMDRRVPLWPETVKAIKAVIAKRPKVKDEADVNALFLTRCGERWVRNRDTLPALPTPNGGPDEELSTGGVWIDSVGLVFGKLLRKLELKKEGINFYTLRHVFETVAGATKDQAAVDSIMGHVADAEDMGDRYREEIEDDRLKAVTDHVRKWLYPPKRAVKPKEK